MDLSNLDPFWLVAIGLAAGMVLFLTLLRWIRKGDKKQRRKVSRLAVDVRHLDDRGPSTSGPRLEFYGTPVRLVIVVIAPAGRKGESPPKEVVPGLMGHLVPGLTEVFESHKPICYRWPVQLSSQGFAQSFFNNVALPGDRGKSTPWCSITGKLQVGERTFLVGLVCSSGTPNNLSQVVAQHEGQWLDILRIHQE